MQEIEIGLGRSSVTDANEVHAIMRIAPMAHRRAQDVLVAAKKVIQKKGLFSSERSRVTNLIEALRSLHLALDQDGYANVAGSSSGKARMFAFFNRFARAYPNWQAEYSLLNRVIPHLFQDESEHQTAWPVRSSTGSPAEGRAITKAESITVSTKMIILCPNCHSQMRIPVGVRIRVTCRDCGNKFVQELQE